MYMDYLEPFGCILILYGVWPVSIMFNSK
jgi:hypothetical protein